MRQLLKVARMGHPVLRRVADAVDPAQIAHPDFQDFIDSMLDTMIEYEGVGLAAPQVHESVQVVVFHEDAGLLDADGEPLEALINPTITALTEDTSSMWEGCLSIPGLRGKVSRPNRIQVEALDREGRAVSMVLEEFAAVVMQHECDHLLGKLFIDRLDDTRELSYQEEFDRHWVQQAEEDGVYIDQ